MPEATMKTINNTALDLLHRFWRWEADWMVCQGCKRPLIASRDGEPLGHATGCPNADHVHPWADLRQALGSPEEAQALHTRLTEWRANRELDLVSRARAIVIELRRASVSTVQRRLAIQYYEADHLMAMLEKQGVVGPKPASGPRAFTWKSENSPQGSPKSPETPAP